MNISMYYIADFGNQTQIMIFLQIKKIFHDMKDMLFPELQQIEYLNKYQENLNQKLKIKWDMKILFGLCYQKKIKLQNEV